MFVNEIFDLSVHRFSPVKKSLTLVQLKFTPQNRSTNIVFRVILTTFNLEARQIGD